MKENTPSIPDELNKMWEKKANSLGMLPDSGRDYVKEFRSRSGAYCCSECMSLGGWVRPETFDEFACICGNCGKGYTIEEYIILPYYSPEKLAQLCKDGIIYKLDKKEVQDMQKKKKLGTNQK